MQPKPRVSVILTYFNYRDFVPEAIASVMAQTYSDVELIVVDDCSESPSGLEQLVTGDFNGKIVRHSYNQGLPTARNTGVAASTGELLVIMDSDDLLAPDFIEKTVRHLGELGVDGVYTQVQTFGDRHYLWTPDCSLFNLLAGVPGPATFLMKREVFDALGGYKPHLPLNSDHDFWIGSVAKGFQFARLDEPLYLYRKHARSLSAVHREARHHAVPILYAEYPRLYDENVKDLLALKEKQFRQLEDEYDNIWQEWHSTDAAWRTVSEQYASVQNRLRFADLILESPIFRAALFVYRKLRRCSVPEPIDRSLPSS